MADFAHNSEQVKAIVQAQEAGLNPICSTCRHMWRALNQGHTACGQGCGSPLSVGLLFPKYDGVMPPAVMQSVCFVTGGDSEYVLFRPGLPDRKLGVSQKGLDFIRRSAGPRAFCTGLVYAKGTGGAVTPLTPHPEHEDPALVVKRVEGAS